MTATVIDGKAYAAGLRARVAKEVEALGASHGVIPGLAVVLVGEDPASQVYVRNKNRQTREAGMGSFEHKLEAGTPESELLALIDRLNHDPHVHGILVQLPLPKHIDADRVIDVGINRVAGPDGANRLVGDVAYDECAAVAGAITPVPGGVGPMTIACLLANTLTACRRSLGLDPIEGLTP
jgi:5,10-methylene-tetrahydrofolate dehydrogenase/methenyl tetrahydrofolate cyclohydrolase